jgi:hypothetical protein
MDYEPDFDDLIGEDYELEEHPPASQSAWGNYDNNNGNEDEDDFGPPEPDEDDEGGNDNDNDSRNVNNKASYNDNGNASFFAASAAAAPAMTSNAVNTVTMNDMSNDNDAGIVSDAGRGRTGTSRLTTSSSSPTSPTHITDSSASNNHPRSNHAQRHGGTSIRNREDEDLYHFER